jgi:hypothetical protein
MLASDYKVLFIESSKLCILMCLKLWNASVTPSGRAKPLWYGNVWIPFVVDFSNLHNEWVEDMLLVFFK